MTFETYVPAPPLDQFVQFLWFYDGFMPDHTREKLLPDASMELIIDLREHPKKLYDANHPARFTEFRHAWLSGMHTGFIVIDASPGSMMGAHFRPGGAWPFFSTPLSEFTDKVVPFDCVVGRAEAVSLRDHLLHLDTYQQKFSLLESFLLAKGGDRLRIDPLLGSALPDLLSRMDRPQLRIKDLAHKVGVSQRHLIQCFEKKIGLKPKQLERVVRFQQAVKFLERKTRDDVDWATVAIDCGYYDQSHFINDFQRFSSYTPSDYLLQVREHQNYIILDPALAVSA